MCAISPLTTCSVSTITPHCSRKKAARKSLYRYLTCVTKAVRSTRTEHELMKRRKAKQPNMKFRSSPAGTHTYEVKRICTPSIYAAGTPLAFVHLAFPRRHRATRGSSKASALWHRCQRSRCGISHVQPLQPHCYSSNDGYGCAPSRPRSRAPPEKCNAVCNRSVGKKSDKNRDNNI